MRRNAVVFSLSAAIIFLITAHAAASLYFCAGSLKGEFAGCAAMIGDDLLRSRAVQLGATAAALGFLYALWKRRRR